MKLRTHRGFGNVLLRKVRRHSNFATLFSTSPIATGLPVQDSSRIPIPVSGKTIVQAKLAVPGWVETDTSTPLPPVWDAFLPGRAIPSVPSTPEKPPLFTVVDGSKVRSIPPDLSAGRPLGAVSGKISTGKKSIWQRLAAAIRPAQEATPGPAPEKVPGVTYPAKTSFLSTTLQTQASEPDSPPSMTQPPISKGEPGRLTPTAAPDKSGLSSDDWRVLQAIHRRHQEKDRQAATVESKEEAVQPSLRVKPAEIREELPAPPASRLKQFNETATQKSPGEQETNPIRSEPQPKAESLLRRGLLNVFRRKTEPPQPKASAVITRKAETAERKSVPSSSTEAGAGAVVQLSLTKELPSSPPHQVESHTAPSSPPVKPEKPIQLEKTQTESAAHVGQVPEYGASVAGQVAPTNPSTASPAIPAEVPGEIPEPGAPRLEESTLATPKDKYIAAQEEPVNQAIPLQEIWPVEEVQDKTAIASSPGAGSDLQNPTIGETEESSGRVVQRALEDVSTGEPTGSSVEVIAPRRPRPVQMAPEQAAPIQKKPASNEMVHTDIGELPADLWHLIGETPPPQTQHLPGQNALSSTPQSELEARIPARVSPVQRSIRDDKPAATSEKSSDRHFAPEISGRKKRPAIQSSQATAIIQRQENQPEEATGAAGPVEMAKTDKSDGEEINIEALSNQVYREVKRRMSIEWERTRRY
jgi:hypothetical protein